MGALHKGHLSIIRTAVKENDEVFISIYVNPTQFAVDEDFESYPRKLESDMKQLNDLNKELTQAREQGASNGVISTVFAPRTDDMYPGFPPSSEPEAEGTYVMVSPMSAKLEGSSRPIFFRGVATVCAKLFNIVQPDRAYFGQKDIQQSTVLQHMVRDLHFDTKIGIVPTVRDPNDDLALSSRNAYLGPFATSARRQAAGQIVPTMLQKAKNRYLDGCMFRNQVIGDFESLMHGEVQYQEVKMLGKEPERIPWKLDYISYADPEDLEELDFAEEDRGAILSVAVIMLPLDSKAPNGGDGKEDPTRPVRLIDNEILSPVPR